MNNCNHPQVVASSVRNVYECIDCNFLSAGVPSGSSVIAVAASQTNNPVKQFIYNPNCLKGQGHAFNFSSTTSTYTCVDCPYILTATEVSHMSTSDARDLRSRILYRNGQTTSGVSPTTAPQPPNILAKPFVYDWRCARPQHSFNFMMSAVNFYFCVACGYKVTATEASGLSTADSRKLVDCVDYMDGQPIPRMGAVPLAPPFSLQPVQQGVNPTHMPLTIADLQEVVDKYRIQYGREPNDILVSDLLRHYIPSNAYGGYINNIPVHFGDTSPNVYSIFAMGPNATYMEKDLSIPVSSHTTSIISSGLRSGALTQGPGIQAAPITLPWPYVLIQGLGPEQEELNRVHRAVCTHTWQHYAGLTEVYDFCTKCDEKKR